MVLQDEQHVAYVFHISNDMKQILCHCHSPTTIDLCHTTGPAVEVVQPGHMHAKGFNQILRPKPWHAQYEGECPHPMLACPHAGMPVHLSMQMDSTGYLKSEKYACAQIVGAFGWGLAV